MNSNSLLGKLDFSPSGDPSFLNNVPDPLLAGDELPTFKFELEKSHGKAIGNSEGKEATVRQLPISKGIAGVSMRLEPGATRELHWHATAAEWAYVNEGRVRTTVIAPGGVTEINEFAPGDVWYFPRGHGHVLECLGSQPCHFILIFDNGYFSEFGTFSISDWIGHVPKPLLAKNFGLPEFIFESFPTSEVYFGKGRIPPEPPAVPLGGPGVAPPRTHRYSLMSDEPTVDKNGGKMWVVDSTKFPISRTLTGAVLELPQEGLRELHWHPNADEWQYVLEGKVSVTLFGSGGRFRTETLEQGDVGFIPQGYGHSIENIGDGICRVLLGFNSGTHEYIDLSSWIAGNPVDVLISNFSVAAKILEQFPKEDVKIAPPN